MSVQDWGKVKEGRKKMSVQDLEKRRKDECPGIGPLDGLEAMV